jgi:hypothetical protein
VVGIAGFVNRRLLAEALQKGQPTLAHDIRVFFRR